MPRSTLLYKAGYLLLALLLTGCSAGSYHSAAYPERWLQNYGLIRPSGPDTLQLCTHFGCGKTQLSRFSITETHQISALFYPPASTAHEERQRIAAAIALMETQQGPKLHTQHDLAKNQAGLFSGSNQLDCIAETANTSVYLLLLEKLALLQYHRVSAPLHRGPLNLLMPHNSAAILEVQSGQLYAVDSWFYRNGEQPWITTAEQWRSGASPQE